MSKYERFNLWFSLFAVCISYSTLFIFHCAKYKGCPRLVGILQYLAVHLSVLCVFGRSRDWLDPYRPCCKADCQLRRGPWQPLQMGRDGVCGHCLDSQSHCSGKG